MTQFGTTPDYMQHRPLLRLHHANMDPDELDPKRVTLEEKMERLSALRCASRDVFLRLVSNPEMADVPALALASRSVVLAEALLAELHKAEFGETLTEEENMKNGALFRLFREQFYAKREASGA